jgi:alkylation response protein AidB-like acyl-CoA dehydrogenase
MEFQLTDEQELLRDTVRSFLGDSLSLRRRYFDADAPPPLGLWRQLGELGVTGLAIDLPDLDTGSSVIEQMLVAEELGRVTAPAPFATAAAANSLLAASADPSSHRLLAEAVESRLVVAALPGIGTIWPGLVADLRDGRASLRGTVPVVAGGAWADVVLVVATTGGGDDIVCRIDAGAPGVGIEPLRSLDPTTGLAALHLDDAAADIVLHDAGHDVARATDLATLLVASEATGVAEQATRMAADYARDRVQFGHPIGAFQAIKHKLADMVIGVENARSAVYGAAWAMHGDNPDTPVLVSMAKAVASEATVQVAAETLQIHGGIGCTFEADPHLYLRRAKTCALLFGSSVTHLERIARHVLDETQPDGVAR